MARRTGQARGGGGGTDVRICGRSNTCAGAKSCGYGDRIIAAGGGGGGGGSADTATLDGGLGGGSAGAASADGFALGGRQELTPCPYTGVPDEQLCATTGDGKSGSGFDETGGGGGGGGWFGGFGGGSGGGGGGSGYISPLSLSGSFPGGTGQGDGKVIITTTT